MLLATSEEKEGNMRGGSLTRFRPDEYYDQDGKGVLADMFRGGLQGLKRTRNPLKLPIPVWIKSRLDKWRETKSRTSDQTGNHQTS